MLSGTARQKLNKPLTRFNGGIESEVSVRAGRGDAASHIYFSDLTHDYIRINAEYTT